MSDDLNRRIERLKKLVAKGRELDELQKKIHFLNTLEDKYLEKPETYEWWKEQVDYLTETLAPKLFEEIKQLIAE